MKNLPSNGQALRSGAGEGPAKLSSVISVVLGIAYLQGSEHIDDPAALMSLPGLLEDSSVTLKSYLEYQIYQIRRGSYLN